MFWRRAGCLLVFVSGFAVPIADATTACADTMHHAALIIDTGDHVVRRCVGFNEDTISGQDMLDRADVGVVYSNKYSEAFVCSILGVGNDQAHCPNGDPNQNWVYWQAPSGSSVYTRPNQGASRTKVHDGDVEAWHWTTGLPPYTPASEVCPAAPPPTTPATTAASAPPATVGGTLPKQQDSTDTPGVVGTMLPTGATSTSPEATTTVEPSSTTSTKANDRVALAVDDSKGGSPLALGAVGALIIGIGIAAWRINRRRTVPE